MKKLLKILLSILFDPIKTIIVNMEGRLGIFLRRLYYRMCLGGMGKGLRIDPGVYISNPKHVYVGDYVWIDRGAQLIAGPPGNGLRLTKQLTNNPNVPPGILRIGNRCHIAPNVIIQAHGGVSIGSELTIAAGAKIYSLSHHYRDPDKPNDITPYLFVGMVDPALQFLIKGPVVIADGAGVGMNVVMLPGSALGRHAWLTIGSVLIGSIPTGGIASGNPAQTLKFRPGFKEPESDEKRP